MLWPRFSPTRRQPWRQNAAVALKRGRSFAVSVFNFNAASLGKEAISGAQRRYTVASGDTLRSIAQGVYGDSNLWYLIADANGLEADDPLVPGSSLILPDGASNANTSQIYKPWDTAHTVGDTSPTLPMPPANAGGCGGVGTAMMIIVAIAVTVLTAGAGAIIAEGGMSTLGSASLSQVASAGASALTGGTVGGAGIAVGAGSASISIGTGTAIGASVVGGAVGSIASQGLAIGTGMQDQFSWRQVGMSALTAGVGSGVGSVINQMGITAKLNDALVKAMPPSAAQTAQTATTSIQAMGSNTITQQSLRLSGLQDQFSWRQVAAAAAGGALGSGMGNGGGFSDDLLRGFASGIGAGLVAGRGKVDGWSAFGNAFGQAFANRLGGAPATAGVSQQEQTLVVAAVDTHVPNIADVWNDQAAAMRLPTTMGEAERFSIALASTPGSAMVDGFNAAYGGAFVNDGWEARTVGGSAPEWRASTPTRFEQVRDSQLLGMAFPGLKLALNTFGSLVRTAGAWGAFNVDGIPYDPLTNTMLSAGEVRDRRTLSVIEAGTFFIGGPAATELGAIRGGLRVPSGVEAAGVNTASLGRMGWPGIGGTGPAPGVIGITDGTSVGVLRNYYPKGGGVEFVFDPTTNTFVAGRPVSGLFQGSPHEQLAQSIGAAERSTTVGGTFQRGANGEIFTTENSGHFGKNWTDSVRLEFQNWLNNRAGMPVNHQPWSGK